MSNPREPDSLTADAQGGPRRAPAAASAPDSAETSALADTISPPLDGTQPAPIGSGPAARGTGLQAIAGERLDLGLEIGRGGMGRVLRANDRLLGRPVAVKLLLASGSEARQRF